MTKRESFVSIMEDNLIKHWQLTAKLAGHQCTATGQMEPADCQSSASVTAPKIINLEEDKSVMTWTPASPLLRLQVEHIHNPFIWQQTIGKCWLG